MRVKIYNTQSVLIVDTSHRADPVSVILQALDAIPVFFNEGPERCDLIDAGGTPQIGWFLTNAMPPKTLLGNKLQLWARAAAETLVEVQVYEVRIETVPARQIHGMSNASQNHTRFGRR
jgi:hypothetical protein